MDRDNPSFILSLEAVDEIVDRLLKGKYTKRPPTNKELWQSGLMGNASASHYVRGRWPDLTPAGVTMRSNKLCKLLADAHYRENLRKDDSNSDPDCVWRIYNRSSGYDNRAELHIAGPGATTADISVLRQQTWLLYGWLWNGAVSRPESLYVDKVGMGGRAEVSIRNRKLISDIKNKIGRIDQEIRDLNGSRAAAQHQVEALESMSLMTFANAEF